MENKTKYDLVVDFLFDYWIIAVLVILAVIVGFIPNLRDGLTQLFSWLSFKKRHKEFIVISSGETITFETRTKSAHFDVVKINCLTHTLGVRAEYQWIEKFYPKFRTLMQGLQKIEIDENQTKHYDVIEIINDEGKKKTIYFDISSFFNEHGSSSFNRDKFIKSKIKELHKKSA